MRGSLSSECEHGGDIWDKGLNPRSLLDFSSNVNPLGASRRAVRAIASSMWRISLYPDPKYEELRSAIARYVNSSPSRIAVSNGASEAIYLLSSLLLKPGDKAAIFIPTFCEYSRAALSVGAVPKYVDVGLKMSWRGDALESLRDAKVIFLCRPNNPTGDLARRDFIEIMAENSSRRNSYLIIDESFIDFVENSEYESVVRLVDKYDNLIIVRSLTKFFALTGLRIGFCVANEDMIKRLEERSPPWRVNCFAEVAAIESLKDSEYIKRTRLFIHRERDFLFRGIEETGKLKPIPSSANFLLVDTRMSGMSGRTLKEKLLQKMILIKDCGSIPGLDKFYVRISVSTRERNELLLKRLSEVVGE